MAAIITGRSVIARFHPIKVWRKIGVGEKRRAAAVCSEIAGGQVPTGPIRFAQIIAVIERLDGTLDEKMIMVIGVAGGVARIAELHLILHADEGARRGHGVGKKKKCDDVRKKGTSR